MPRGAILDLRSSWYATLELAAIDAWVHGKAFTLGALVESVKAATGAAITSANASYYFNQLARRGEYVSQPAKFGAKGATEATGRPTTPYMINRGHLDASTITLRHAVEPYLADPQIGATRKHALRSALRFQFELPEQCAQDRILQACEAVSAPHLYGLPRQVREMASAGHLSKKTGQNHAAAVAHMLRYAGERRLVPVVFPQYMEMDAWEVALQQYWPLPSAGRASKVMIGRRRAWRVYGAKAKEILGSAREPESITRQEADRVLAALRQCGKFDVVTQIRTMLRRLAADRGAGPYVETAAIDPFIIQADAGPRSALMLQGGGTGWDGLIACLREHGFPVEMITYLEWYGAYIAMPTVELLEHGPLFPHRKKAHRLGTLALDGRAQGLRAFFGAAILELELDPATLTPAVAFGHESRRIVAALIGWWNRRRRVLPTGAVGSAQAAGLHGYVIGAAMMAYTLYEKLRFERRLTVAQRNSSSGKTTLTDRRAEEGAPKTADEAALWEAYVDLTGTAVDLKASAMERLGVSDKGGVPEIRDVRRILEQTPPPWWMALLQAMINKMREERSAGRNVSFWYHRLVQNTFELGVFISTGCRDEEGCIIRNDLHYTPELWAKRQVSFTGRDRKNRKATRVWLHPEYVPDDVRLEYEERTRRFFMHDNHVQRGRLPVADHPFLFVNERGQAYGYRYEDMEAEMGTVTIERIDGESETDFVVRFARERRRVRERHERAFHDRVQRHGKRVQRSLARYAVEFGLELPEGLYEFGLHPVRIACGYAIYLLKGTGAAAAYLGDTEETALQNYSAIDGVNVDSTCLLAAAESAMEQYREQAQQGRSAPPVSHEFAAGAVPARFDSDRIAVAVNDAEVAPLPVMRGYADQLSALIEAKRQGDIDAEEFALAKADLKARVAGGGKAERSA